MEWLKLRGRPVSDWSQWFVMLLVGLLVSIFASTIINSAPVSAADAEWNNGSLSRNGDTYSPVTDAATIQAMGLPSGSQVFTTSSSTNSAQQGVQVIYFPPGTQLDTAASASYVEYDFTPPDTWSTQSSSAITVDTTTYSAGGGGPGTSSGSGSGTGCNVAGVGWWVCGPSMWIAKGMDLAYSWLDGFLTTRPLEVTNSTSVLFMAWNIMRGIANALFIVAFLIIIYSQISSVGLSNYSIKKMAPRLIIAALLVNISYFLCALAVDLSNITGIAIKDMFDTILNQLVQNGTANNSGVLSSESIIQAFISGGSIAIAGGLAIGGTSTAATPLVVPLLLTLLLSLIVALLVLAVRQAIITILIIISPLAFVCYLLPGTEQWFQKWSKTFFTMLIFFPAFAVVFGGANLAGILITTNAQSIVALVLGWVVQLAPLAITPFIMKLGGGLLNRFAGIVNNPSKGIIDKSKQWAEKKSKQIQNDRTFGNDNLKRRHFMRRAARRINRGGKLLDDRLAEAQMRADNSYHSWDKYKKLDTAKRETEMAKETIQKELDNQWNNKLTTNVKLIEKDLKLRVTADQVELGKARLDNRYDDFKAGAHPTGFVGPLAANDPMYQLMNTAQETTRNIAVEGLRKTNTGRALNQQMADSILRNDDLQQRAAGLYEFGKDAAIASAVSTMRGDYAKAVEEGTQILRHFELSAEQRQEHAMGREEFTVYRSDGTNYTFTNSGIFTREAAIEEQVATGTEPQVGEIVAASGGELRDFKSTISSALAKSSIKGKAPYMGGKLLNDIAKGDIANEADLQGYIVEWLANGKFKPADVSTMDKDALTRIIDSLGDIGSQARAQVGERRLMGLHKKIDTVFANPELKANVADNAYEKFRQLRDSLPAPGPGDDDL